MTAPDSVIGRTEARSRSVTFSLRTGSRGSSRRWMCRKPGGSTHRLISNYREIRRSASAAEDAGQTRSAELSGFGQTTSSGW